MKCFGTYIKKFSSTKLKTKDYECYKNISNKNIMKNMMMKMEKLIFAQNQFKLKIMEFSKAL